MPDQDPDRLDRIEQDAAEIARIAGAEIETALGRGFAVAYKDSGPESFRDPVSEVDHDVERIVRAKLAEDYPGHDVIGEESPERPGLGEDWAWAIDPIDGTSNFVNGLPLFAATIGVLHRGVPMAGAVWCSATHALRPGVYSARRGSGLSFDGIPYRNPPNPAVRRRLAGVPDLADPASLPFDGRKTGSAALECALVAAGLLQGARFKPLNLWDVAGGVCLALAAGCEVWIRTGGGWQRFERFEPMSRDGGAKDLRDWRGEMILGSREAADAMRRL
ncbi:inositol monophosphatase family protein [Parvularcula oceani]|uniref:inositol monophosphatase family protein n=1 Tax=Parvularcula oceani TaxID=1247963 RepID=UPI0004E16B9D|nr:inositol monophosphatase [Parvularcula oceani]